MDKIVIDGGRRLKGQVEISGSKNSALPILAAAILTSEESVIENVPQLRDISTMIKILKDLGARAHQEGNVVTIRPGDNINHVAPYKLVSTMRASVCLLGPLLGRLKKAEVSMPGGCVIGARPIDLHLKGMEMLGAKITIEHGNVKASAKRLRGADMYLGGPFGSSVLATANIMMAATLAEGITRIESAASEPELVDLANFLNSMGAKVRGAGSHLIEIEGVKKLHGTRYKVIPDRIEAGTFMVAAALTKGDIRLKNIVPEHNNALLDKLREAGVGVETNRTSARITYRRKIKPVDVTTLPYPGFPTDLQAQMMSLMTVTQGISVITEKIYPDRFMHISELNRMGSKIHLEGNSAIVAGVKRLSGAPVMASDLRASAALVLAGLVAEGRTDVHRVYHLDRGYERIEEKLNSIGAKIWREKE
ncbi:MAG: UDP-N-acetylglucosamine 1-carboxyvinyltransferase [Candidatus Omnitrophica bacterium]|nr:UDP-N-acetylglucosamine 1-carboxyvinyltransferase [Candidatus Omnitrophota bacterium]